LLVPVVHGSLVVEELIPHEQRGAQRAAGIARRRLDPDVLEGRFPQDSTVRDAVERHAAGQVRFFMPVRL